MTEKDLIETIRSRIKSEFSGESSGHDWWHIYRVTKLAMHICEEEGVDSFKVELAALLHDVGDHKFHGGEDQSARETERYLREAGCQDDSLIGDICTIVEGVSFKGAGVNTHANSLEGRIVQDADRLDAMGAIGVARTFAYGGAKGRIMYDPKLKPSVHQDFEAYKNSKGPTVNHFYEKLLLLKDRMGTATGMRMAQKRHDFMLHFLGRFFEEWEGEDL